MIKKRRESESISLRYWVKSKGSDDIYVVNCYATRTEHTATHEDDTAGRWLAGYNTYPLVPPTEDGKIVRVNFSTDHLTPVMDKELEWLRYSFQSPTSFKQWVTENIEKIEQYCIFWDTKDLYNY